MNSSTPIPSSQASSVDERLARVESTLAKLNSKSDPSKENKPDNSVPKESSKPLLALMFGFIGMKLGVAVVGKVGLLVDTVKAMRATGLLKGFKEVAFTFFSFDKNAYQKTLPTMIMGGFAGMIVGALGGVALGWTRGDRLDNPSDLFKHPGDSLKKIFGPAPVKPTSTLEAAPQHPVTAAQHQGTVAAALKQQTPAL